jgi:formiminotetrahydrofolate cyclodeaminase
LLDLSIGEFLDHLAAEQPTPGGGSVAALGGALAASLGRMVCAYTLGRKKFADVEPRVRGLAERFKQSDTMLRALIDADAAAYSELSAAFKLGRDDAGRDAAIRKAAEPAALTPLTTAGLCRAVLSDLEELAGVGNPNLASDVRAAVHFAQAGLRAAAENVRVNLPLLDKERAEEIERELGKLVG